MEIRFAKRTSDGVSAAFSLETLVDTRLLIQANSGGGKSYLIRGILETTHGKVQQIVLDLEGEFSTLREKFPYILAGKGGDIPTDVRTAELLARRILKLGKSIIIDLYELKQQERKQYVRVFLEALVNAPKELWHPVLVVVDEAHQFCPEKEEAESAAAVVDLLTRGRKRGQCGILATQRLAKLNKDAAAECNNVLIGRTGLDVDMKRAGEILGFAGKGEMLTLRELEPGEFYAYGPALSRKVEKVKVDAVVTSHPKAGFRSLSASPPPAPEEIRKALSELSDLPAEAHRELREKSDFVEEIRRLKRELAEAKSGAPKIDPARMADAVRRAEERGAKAAEERVGRELRGATFAVGKLKAELQGIAERAARAAGAGVPTPAAPVSPSPAPRPLAASLPPVITKAVIVARPLDYHQSGDNDQEEKPLRDGAMKMLAVVARFAPSPVGRTRIATMSCFSERGGTFQTYLGELKRRGWIREGPGGVEATDEGLTAAGPVEPLPDDPHELVEMWAGKFREGAAKILRYVASRYPEWVPDQDVEAETHFTSSGGTYQTYVGELRRNRLLERTDGQLRASPELMEGLR